jgi:diguanylate cyclase (GGDEF)-like protein
LIFHDFAYIGRYGGDEFIAVMSNHSKQEITSKFEDLYANLKFNYVNNFTLSVSVGIAIGNRRNGILIRKELLVSADKALYEAKKQGKNRFIFSQ